ncbi:MAG TPA: heavy metal-associated domain-containing protein [Candidatus Angelobacter sp.]|nr:heavy metal-associated domain-containing protein [Candidatus Angelobacter sp.]
MNRRRFLRRVMTGVAGTTMGIGVAKAGLHLGEASAQETRRVVCEVKGFSCITCATGLEVMLRQEKGVTQASASYPDGKVVIGFDENLISEDKLKEFIVRCGFSVV